MVFQINKKKNSKLRKAPFIPRIGIYVDVAGYEMTYKRCSFIEALMNLGEKGVSVENFRKITKAQLAEIKFPKFVKKLTVDAPARTISSQIK